MYNQGDVMKIDPAVQGKYAVHTYRNTEFTVWWQMLNGHLARLNLPEAPYGTARDYYRMGDDPQTAAANEEAIERR
jgi:hypothetical protein